MSSAAVNVQRCQRISAAERSGPPHLCLFRQDVSLIGLSHRLLGRPGELQLSRDQVQLVPERPGQLPDLPQGLLAQRPLQHLPLHRLAPLVDVKRFREVFRPPLQFP